MDDVFLVCVSECLRVTWPY